MTYEFTYNSYSEYLDATLNTPRQEGANEQSVHNRPAFTNGYTYAQCVDLAKRGWPEGRERVREMAVRIANRITSKEHKPEIAFDVTGDCFDMGRVISGIPENAMFWEPTEHPKEGQRIVKVVMSGSVSAAVAASTLERRGAATCALVECLENLGYRCEVWVSMGFGTHGKVSDNYFSHVCVKQATAPIQFDQLAFALVHSGSMRRIGFKWLESVPTGSATLLTHAGYGMPIDSPMADQADIYIGKMLSDGSVAEFQSESGVEAWVMAQLKKQGITLE